MIHQTNQLLEKTKDVFLNNLVMNIVGKSFSFNDLMMITICFFSTEISLLLLKGFFIQVKC